MDTTTASGELLFHVFGALAQYERALIQERVVAGLAAAKRRGRVGGRPPAIVGEKLDAILAALDGGMSKAAVCRNFGVKRTTLIETLARVGWPASSPLWDVAPWPTSGSSDEQWTLAPAERELVMTKNRANRLGFAILLTFFRERGRFPRDEAEVEAQGIARAEQTARRADANGRRSASSPGARRNACAPKSACASASARPRSPMPMR